jgi:hypothetical protein
VAPHFSEPATKAFADCYLAAFAEAAGAKLVTFDKARAATPQTRQAGMVLLKPDTRSRPPARVRARKRVES